MIRFGSKLFEVMMMVSCRGNVEVAFYHVFSHETDCNLKFDGIMPDSHAGGTGIDIRILHNDVQEKKRMDGQGGDIV